MSNKENEFAAGLIVKPPHEKAPEYVKAKISIKREELIAWLQCREGEWVNLDVKESRGGKWYASVDNYRKERTATAARESKRAVGKVTSKDEFEDSEIPF